MRSPAIKNRSPRWPYRLLLGVLFAITVYGQTIDEYQVKAAFLYNFAKFVEWPPGTFKTDKDPIRICVLGQDPFGPTLDNAVNGRKVLGRAFVIMPISDAAHASECQELFVSSSERRHLRSILANLRTAAVLTVGETEGFAAQGGMVNFKLEDGRVRLEINVDAAEEAKLRISSKVLNLSEIVGSRAHK